MRTPAVLALPERMRCLTVGSETISGRTSSAGVRQAMLFTSHSTRVSRCQFRWFVPVPHVRPAAMMSRPSGGPTRADASTGTGLRSRMGRRRDLSRIESLEPRRLLGDMAAALAAPALASVPFPNVDVSQRVGNESEPTVTIDRTDPNRVFVASNTDLGRSGVFVAYSTDAGATWNGRIIGDGDDDLPRACCDTSAAFDAVGNLFLTYINSDKRHVEVLSSTDGGKTFDLLTSFRGDVDQPTLTTGPGSAGSPQSLWLTFDEGDGVVAVGAPVSGLGQVGDFGDIQDIPGSTGGGLRGAPAAPAR